METDSEESHHGCTNERGFTRFERFSECNTFRYLAEVWGEKGCYHVVLLQRARKQVAQACTTCWWQRKKAEVYPEGLLHNILKGLKREASVKNPLNTLEMGPVNEEPYFEEEELAGEDWSSFVDEVSGTALETTKVMAARAGELDYAHRYNVWTLAPLKGCWDNTGKPTIGCRWVDIDKGDSISPNYRSRLAVQEVRTSGTEAIFAATPPLESIRFLLSLQRSRKG